MANEGKFMQIPKSSQQSEKLSMKNLMKHRSKASDEEKRKTAWECDLFLTW